MLNDDIEASLYLGLFCFVMSQHQKELLALDTKPWREHPWKLVPRLSTKSKNMMCGNNSPEIILQYSVCFQTLDAQFLPKHAFFFSFFCSQN